jgi:integron integrase
MKKSHLFDNIREVIHQNHFSLSTEKSYIDWIYRFILFYDKRDPVTMGSDEIKEFLAYLELRQKLSRPTRNQALNALIFLYRKVLDIPLADLVLKNLKPEEHVPDIFTREEVRNVLKILHGEQRLMASLLYGSGMHITECLALRINDICFEQGYISIRGDLWGEDHKTILPHTLFPQLKMQMERACIRFEENILTEGFGGAPVPEEMTSEIPRVALQKEWQFIFPARNLTMDTGSGMLLQYAYDISYLQKAVREAIAVAGISKKVSCRTFRHSFASHLLEEGIDIHAIKEMLGHKDIRSTRKYTQLAIRQELYFQSPLDLL